MSATKSFVIALMLTQSIVISKCEEVTKPVHLNNVNITIQDAVFQDVMTITYFGSELTEHTGSDKEFRLKIVGGNFTTLTPNSVANKRSLISITFIHGNLKVLEPGCITGLPDLRKINLTHNVIEKIDINVFGGLAIEELDLSNNKISAINPSAFRNMWNLKLVNLHSNRLMKFDSAWFITTPVEQLDFSNNEITEIPMHILKLFNLKYKSKYKLKSFDLSHNRVRAIDEEAFADIERIEELNLRANRLIELPHYLTDLETIDVLDISYNPLEWKWFGMFDTSEIKHLRAESYYCIPKRIYDTLLSKQILIESGMRCVQW